MSDTKEDSLRQDPVDAYLHVGAPRFGTAAELIRVIELHSIARANVVLGPGTPDFAALRAVRDHFGDRVRLFGIPFGNSDAERADLAAFQVSMGVSGFRFMPFEMEPGKEVLRLAGENGLWLFAINPYQSSSYARQLIGWLEQHPRGRICSPHFLIPRPVKDACDDPGALKELLRHPRFFATLSRHGGVGSGQAFPHEDLKPWVEDLVGIMGWEKLMWGSEYPVLYWRGEHIPQSLSWMSQLMPSISTEHARLFFGGNAQRLFFDAEAPVDKAGQPPEWIREQWNRGGSVPYFNGALPLDMRTHARLLSRFVESLPESGEASVRDLIEHHLAKSLERNP